MRAYIGSAEVLGMLVAEQPPESGEEARATLHLREAVVAFPGVAFVLRRPSPMTLLGGGFVEGTESANAAGTESPDEAAVLGVLNDRALDAVEPGAIAVAANLREAVVLSALEQLVERGDAVAVSRPRAYVSAAAASSLLARVFDPARRSASRRAVGYGSNFHHTSARACNARIAARANPRTFRRGGPTRQPRRLLCRARLSAVADCRATSVFR